MDELNAYCPIRITHKENSIVYGEIARFVAVGGSVAFDLHFPNSVVVRLQPCVSDYPIRVQYALSRGGHRTVHPNIPVMTIEGQCIRLRTFFGAHPFTRSYLLQCSLVGSASSIPAELCIVDVLPLPLPASVAPVVPVAPVDVSALILPASDVASPKADESESDEDELIAALDEFRETVLANAADCLRTRDARISQLTAERDRLVTWVIPDELSVLVDVVLRPMSPSVFVCKWTPISGILLPALEQYARQCTGLPMLVLKAAHMYSDVGREQAYIDSCSRLNGCVANVQRTWSCGDGQFLMWKSDADTDAWESDVLCIDAGVDIPVTPSRVGVVVSVCPPNGAKSAVIVRVALGRCAHSPSNVTPVHQSAKCGDTTYIVFCASRVIPVYRVLFF
jgi:hypothetical protein